MTRIIEGTCIRNGKELPTYVPQKRIMVADMHQNSEWMNILSDGSYILKTSINTPPNAGVDLKHIAEMFCEIHMESKSFWK
jgi:hypothetical protein